MKRLLLLMVLLFSAALAQEPASQPGEHAETSVQATGEHKTAEQAAEEENEHYIGWKWLNFGILVLVLGYLISKSAPAFFRSRSEAIQRDLEEAGRLRQEAEARVARIEVRMSSLDREIQDVRQEAQSVMAKERDRMVKDADQQMTRMRAQAEQDIESLSNHATQQIRAEAAELAVQLAEQRIQSKMTNQQESELVDRFTGQMERYRSSLEARRS
jgi:F-type H+-transporting ATPase subunit b